jgi:predicted ATPase
MDVPDRFPDRLREIRYSPPSGAEVDRFPFAIAALRSLREMKLDAPVTLFAGENGSGKSTMLEAIAIAAGVPVAGSDDVRLDQTLGEQRRLAARLKLVWSRRTNRGFFLRAEDFFGWVKRMRRERQLMSDRLAEIDRDPQMVGASGDSVARAKGPAFGVIGATFAPDGQDWDSRSHGESFLAYFQSRLVRRGLFLLDEPEAALSPQSQLGLIAMMKEAVAEGSQFIIATHSPILMAAPDSVVISFDRSPPAPVPFEEIESFMFYRSFLQAPERYLRHL